MCRPENLMIFLHYFETYIFFVLIYFDILACIMENVQHVNTAGEGKERARKNEARGGGRAKGG